MKLSTFPRSASALLICSTALALANEPAPAHAQADPRRVAVTWIAETVRQAAPAVVMVEARPSSTGGPGLQMPDGRTVEDFLRRFGDDGQRGLQFPRFGGESEPRTGSGFVIDADGLVVTASELVAGSDAVEVTFDDGTSHDATLVGSDAESGIALVRIQADASLPTLEWGEAGAAAIGTDLVAVSRSEAFGTTAWTGRLAAIDAAGERLLIDDPLGPSAIGAPLLGPEGTVIGVATGGEHDADASIALSSTAARDVVDELSREGAVSRAHLGVQIQPVTRDLADALGLEAAEGALVTDLQPGASAESAGIREGDVILSLDGEEVVDPADLSRRISALEPGETVRLELWRGDERTLVDVELSSAPSDDTPPALSAVANGTEVSVLDLTVGEITPEIRDRFALAETTSGVAVLDVGEDVSAEANLEEGDVIVGVQQQQVGSVSDLQRALDQVQAEGRSAALLLVQRGEARRYVAVPLKG